MIILIGLLCLQAALWARLLWRPRPVSRWVAALAFAANGLVLGTALYVAFTGGAR